MPTSSIRLKPSDRSPVRLFRMFSSSAQAPRNRRPTDVVALVIGLLVGLIAWLWEGSPYLGLVIGLAMLGNLVVAAMAGVVVPMALKTLRIDPALASSIFVTTFTDIMGFFLFLGLATYFLALLS